MNTTKINEKVLSIWEKYYKKDEGLLNRLPLQYPDLKEKPDILFISMNPSSADNFFDKQDTTEDYATFYKYPEKCNSERMKKVIEYEQKARDKYSFYDKMKEFSKNDTFFKYECSSNPWEAIDLFYVRETNQNTVKEFLEKLSDMKKEMVDVSFQLIRELDPKVIICPNAGVRNIFEERFDLPAAFDYEKGVYNLQIKDKKYPVFFTSMLSGQRALDSGSYNLLRWNVSKFLSSLK